MSNLYAIICNSISAFLFFGTLIYKKIKFEKAKKIKEFTNQVGPISIRESSTWIISSNRLLDAKLFHSIFYLIERSPSNKSRIYFIKKRNG